MRKIQTILDYISAKRELIDWTESDKRGFYPYKVTQIIELTREQIKMLYDNDIILATEKERSKKAHFNFHDNKKYNDKNKALYILSECARDSSIQYLIESVQVKDNEIGLLYLVCEALYIMGLLNSTTLYMLIKSCSLYDADEIINYYDIDRERGRKRVISIIKGGAI